MFTAAGALSGFSVTDLAAETVFSHDNLEGDRTDGSADRAPR